MVRWDLPCPPLLGWDLVKLMGLYLINSARLIIPGVWGLGLHPFGHTQGQWDLGSGVLVRFPPATQDRCSHASGETTRPAWRR